MQPEAACLAVMTDLKDRNQLKSDDVVMVVDAGGAISFQCCLMFIVFKA
jgi:hypothetical protein